jgi:hypothetical protein
MLTVACLPADPKSSLHTSQPAHHLTNGGYQVRACSMTCYAETHGSYLSWKPYGFSDHLPALATFMLGCPQDHDRSHGLQSPGDSQTHRLSLSCHAPSWICLWPLGFGSRHLFPEPWGRDGPKNVPPWWDPAAQSPE